MTKLRNRTGFMVIPSRVLISERKEGQLVPLVPMSRPGGAGVCPLDHGVARVADTCVRRRAHQRERPGVGFREARLFSRSAEGSNHYDLLLTPPLEHFCPPICVAD